MGRETEWPFEADAEIVIQALSDFHERSVAGESPVIHQPPMGKLVADMELAALVREGGLSGERLSRFMDQYLSALTRIYHPANIAHQQAVPHYMAALAGLVDSFVSSDGSIYELGPASVTIEYFLINWLLEKVGWRSLSSGWPGQGLRWRNFCQIVVSRSWAPTSGRGTFLRESFRISGTLISSCMQGGQGRNVFSTWI